MEAGRRDSSPLPSYRSLSILIWIVALRISHDHQIVSLAMRPRSRGCADLPGFILAHLAPEMLTGLDRKDFYSSGVVRIRGKNIGGSGSR